jgi:hypothetical protein
MIVRLEIGGYSPRIGWSKLTQETLQELTKNPEAAKFVEPFIDTPPAPKEKEKKKKDIVVKPVPRVEKPEKPGLLAAIATPAGIGIFLVLFLGNLYAAYTIALFRNRSPALVIGVSALLPFIGPLLFLTMPPAAEAEMIPEGVPEPAVAAAAGKSTTGSLAKAPMPTGLSLAAEEKAAAGADKGPQTYKRGEFTFNRRFIETKFTGFFRVVPSDPDSVLVVRTAKAEHVAKRISRITSNEVHLQLIKGGTEVSVPFNEITEMQVRHKDAKA